MSTNPRPYARAARDLCPESAEHHDRVWFCATCLMLEQRLTPLHDIPGIAEILADANLSITVDNRELYGSEGECDESHCYCENPHKCGWHR